MKLPAEGVYHNCIVTGRGIRLIKVRLPGGDEIFAKPDMIEWSQRQRKIGRDVRDINEIYPVGEKVTIRVGHDIQNDLLKLVVQIIPKAKPDPAVKLATILADALGKDHTAKDTIVVDYYDEVVFDCEVIMERLNHDG